MQIRMIICSRQTRRGGLGVPQLLPGISKPMVWLCWGFAQIWRRFFRCFFLAFIFQRDGNLHTGFWYNFCADFGALICAQIFLRRFCAQILRRFSLRRFLVLNTDFCADFPHIFLWSSGVLKIGVPESRKNAHKICGKICGVPTACPEEGSPLHLCCLEKTASHTIAARRKKSRGACECPSKHLGAQRPAFICSRIFQK